MKITIFGGGINGLTATLVVNSIKKDSEIRILTKDLGGNFSSGGLKYLKFTEHTEKFMDECFSEMEYSVKNPIGAVYNEGEIYNFPLYLYTIFNGAGIQEKYWIKTGRDKRKFDNRCMNDALNFRTELSIDLKDKFDSLTDVMSNKVRGIVDIEFIDFNLDIFNKAVIESDIVIYTLPLSFLSKVIGKELKSNFVASDLNIHKYKISEMLLNKIWFNYIYIPGDEYKFHRLTVDANESMIHCEINSEENIDEDVDNFIIENFGKPYYTQKVGQVNIKGQITTDVDIELVQSKLPENVVLLGRFAEWNKRITWDDVVEKLYTDEVITNKLSELYIK
jgi:hypothetical protein